MLYNRTLDRALMLIVPVALIAYASTRPQIRLRADMPAEFVDVQATANPARRAEEERLAREYWECALTLIQWKYTYASPLPSTPPEEFWIPPNPTPGSEPESSSRLRYWRRLRQVWLMPSAWKTTHEWNATWLTQPLKEGWTWIDTYVKDLIHRG